MFFLADYFVHETAEVSDKARIGKGTKIWHLVQIREGTELGENCIIGKNAYIDVNCRIGKGVKIQNNCNIYGAIIEDNVFIGPAVCFTNDKLPRAFIWDENRRTKPITVKKGASVGANSTITPEITIEEFAMVGAGSVVTKNVPPHALVVGNPAKQIAWVCECGQKFEKKTGKAKCSACGKEFQIPE